MDVTGLQEEANKALSHLLVTRSFIDVRWRKQVSNFGMALCQNESETTEAIKKVKTLCPHTIWDAETHQTVLISNAKVQHTAHIKEIEDNCSHISAETENCCSSAIWDTESQGASNAHSIQQSHTKGIQHLEVEAIEEEVRDCLTFHTTWSAALRANPPEALDIMVTPYHLLLGNAPTSALLSISPGVSPSEQEPALQLPPSSVPAVTRPSPQFKQGHNLPGWGGSVPTCGYLQCGS